MILIQNIKEHVGKKDGKAFKTFAVLGVFEGVPVEVKGWRYFDESGQVKPPSMKAGAYWTTTFVSPDELIEAVRRAFLAQQLGEGLEGYETSQKAWEGFLAVVEGGEERIDEVYTALKESSGLTPAQQVVRMLLEVLVNPENFDRLSAEELFSVGGEEK